MEARKCRSFLRPLCGCKEPFRQQQASGSYSAEDSHVDHPTPHQSFVSDPHTPCTNHTSHFPSVPLLPDYTPLDCSPPPIWQCQSPHLRSHFPSITPCTIHLIRQHPISLCRLACRGKWRRCLPGPCHFSKHTR